MTSPRIDRHLPTDGDIHDAALWRLAGFPQEDTEAATARLARIIEQGIPLDSRRPEVAQLLDALTVRKDRRGPWTALMALTVMFADAHGDPCLFYRAGAEVVAAHRGSVAKSEGAPRTELADMMAAFQEERPGAGANECFNAWQELVVTQRHPVLADYDAERDVLSYEHRGELREVTRESFARQFRRVREGMKKTFSETRAQGLVVRRAA